MDNEKELLLKSSSSEDMTPEMGLRVGYALAHDYHTVLVGSDIQKSSLMMKNAIISALLSCGSDVIDIEEISAPALALDARNADCAVYVTEEYNNELISGYELLNSDGSPFNAEQMRHLLAIDNRREENKDLSDSFGVLKHHHNAIRHYNNLILSLIPNTTSGTIVLNCNCGIATDSAPQIISTINADIVSLNAQKDSNFSDDALSIKETDTRHMKTFIESNKGCIGISINRTGSALRAFDENGEPLSYEHILALLMLYLKPKFVIAPIDSSALIEDIFSGKINPEINTFKNSIYGGEPILIYKDIHSDNIHELFKTDQAGIAYFDGKFIYNDVCLYPDAIHTAALLACMAGENSLKTIIENFPEYHREKKNYKLYCTYEIFLRAFKEKTADRKISIIEDNGCLRVKMEGGWFLLSLDKETGTSVELLIESDDKLYLVSTMDVIDDIIKKCCVTGQ